MRKKMWCMVTAALLALSARAFAADMVDNPAYKSWAQYKAGTTVTIQNQIKADGKVVGQETFTMKLVEVTAEKVVVESTSSALQLHFDPKKVGIPAKVEGGSEMLNILPDVNPNPNDKPVIKDIKTGKDSVPVGDKKVDTVTQEATIESAPDDPVKAKGTLKTWINSEVPGSMVKIELNLTAPEAATKTWQVTEVKVVK